MFDLQSERSSVWRHDDISHAIMSGLGAVRVVFRQFLRNEEITSILVSSRSSAQLCCTDVSVEFRTAIILLRTSEEDDQIVADQIAFTYPVHTKIA